MITFSTSSWTLHGMLGQAFYEHNLARESWLENGDPSSAGIALLDLPRFVAKDGINQLEICHFHLPSIEPSYIAQLKSALERANVTLKNILIDRGNLADPNDDAWAAEVELCKMWLTIAAELGAQGCRIDCGTEPPSPQSIARAADALHHLGDRAKQLGLTLTTENFRETSVQPKDLLEIIKRSGQPINLCLDFGNAAKTDDKYGTIEHLLPYSSSLHCKAEYPNGELDHSEFAQSMGLVKAADFSGTVALIYGGTTNEWERALELQAEILNILN